MPDLSLTPQATLLTEVDVTNAVTTLKTALEAYDVIRTANWNVCNPVSRLREINLELQTAALADIAALQAEAAGINALLPKYGQPGSPATRNAISQVNAAFADSQAAMIILCNTILAKLNGYLATAQAAEVAFFDTYDLSVPNVPTDQSDKAVGTAVSKRYTTAIAQVQNMLAGYQKPWDFVGTRDPRAITILDWLGVAQIA